MQDARSAIKDALSPISAAWRISEVTMCTPFVLSLCCQVFKQWGSWYKAVEIKSVEKMKKHNKPQQRISDHFQGFLNIPHGSVGCAVHCHGLQKENKINTSITRSRDAQTFLIVIVISKVANRSRSLFCSISAAAAERCSFKTACRRRRYMFT